MNVLKRLFLFFIINIIIITTISFIISIFNLQPYISSFGLQYSSLLIFCLLWGMGGAFISLLLSKKIAKWMMRIKIISSFSDNPEEKELFDLLKKLSEKANLKKMPELGIYDSNEVNAFATGYSQKNSLIAVSKGLLSRLNTNEIEAVLAHEISHITNGDMVTMTLLQGIVNAFVMFLARVLAYLLASRNRGSRNNFSYFSYMAFVFLFQFVFMIFGSMGIALFSRRREYRADKGGAELSSKDKMIDALNALRVLKEVKDPHQEQKAAAIQSLKISNRKTKKGFLRFFATHPPLEDRIERLKNS
jgi:heat shock protein HtpX